MDIIHGEHRETIEGAKVYRLTVSADRHYNRHLYLLRFQGSPPIVLGRGGRGWRRISAWKGMVRSIGHHPPIGRPYMVPIEVLMEGNPMVACYLYCVHGRTPEEVAERLNVAPTTVYQYINDIRRGRR